MRTLRSCIRPKTGTSSRLRGLALALLMALGLAGAGLAQAADTADASGATSTAGSAASAGSATSSTTHRTTTRVVHRSVKAKARKVVRHRPVRRVHHVAQRRVEHAPTHVRAPVHHALARKVSATRLGDDPVNLASGSALVVDARTHQVLLSKDATDVRPIASLTKLMTAAVVLDAHLPMDQRIAITDDDIDTLKWSSSRLRPGMVFTREELLKLALMSSENRAAHALARTYPGGVEACVQAMNRKAASLGMLQTRYIEPTGLSPQNQSTASDLAKLAVAAYAYPLIRQFSTHPHSTVTAGRRELEFRNTDHLIFNRGWDILLQKTGYINEAGHCLVLNTVVQGRNVVVVLLDAWGRYAHFVDAERIRNWMETSGRTMLTRVDPVQSADASATGAVDE
ncbi:MAG: D-alanyl-D-alanine endopeptidase [Betaproteobacteria bacterium]|nr:D-alanyl-D-alanine endopeptidase [Betaproteobacteria bacterium]